jgi:anti-sigma B factor antagonist
MKGTLSLTLGKSPEGTGILKVEGVVDAFTIKQFEAAFKRFEEQGIRSIVVDIAKMDYINSAGLSLLIRAKSEASKHKADVVLVRPQNSVVNIFKIMGLMDLFRIASSVEEALHPPALD